MTGAIHKWGHCEDPLIHIPTLNIRSGEQRVFVVLLSDNLIITGHFQQKFYPTFEKNNSDEINSFCIQNEYGCPFYAVFIPARRSILYTDEVNKCMRLK